MAIARANSSSVTLGHTSPRTFSHDSGSGSDRKLFVGVQTNNDTVTGDQVTGVTYNSVAMTLIDQITVDAFGCLYLFELNDPTTGTNTVAISFNNDSDASVCAVSVNYTGVSQSGSYDAKATGSAASATSLTTSLTTSADNCWCVLVGADFTASSAGADTLEVVEQAQGLGMYDSNAAVSPAGSRSLIFGRDAGTGNHKSVMASFAPAGAATTGNKHLTTIGVG